MAVNVTVLLDGVNVILDGSTCNPSVPSALSQPVSNDIPSRRTTGKTSIKQRNTTFFIIATSFYKTPGYSYHLNIFCVKECRPVLKP